MGINSKRGARGQLVINRDTNFQRDLQGLADEIVQRGHVFQGPPEVKKSLLADPDRYGLKSGDLFHEIYYEDYKDDYDALGDGVSRLFVYSSGGRNGGHFTPYGGGVNKSWAQFRVSDRATDDLAPGQYTGVCALFARGTDWGDYIITISGKWFTANPGQTTIGYRRILLNGKSIPAVQIADPGAGIGDLPSNLGNMDNDVSITFPYTFRPNNDSEIDSEGYPADPTMVIELLLNPASVTGRVWNGGMGITLQYLGRNYT